jgi:hypothetical protein
MAGKPLEFSTENKGIIEFIAEYVLNVGYAGRNEEVVMGHIKELEELGVPAPKVVPTIYPVANNLASTAKTIQVQHGETSGEVEFVLLIQKGQLYVTVGSDHSDRVIEQTNVSWAKQAYPNIIAPRVWNYEEIKGHWDSLVMKCYVLCSGEWVLNQQAPLSDLRPPEELIKLTEEFIGGNDSGIVVFSGTVPAFNGLISGEGYRIELEDSVLNRKISHEYSVELLPPARE